MSFKNRYLSASPEDIYLILVPDPGQRCAAPVNGALAPTRRASLSMRRVIEPGSMQGSLRRMQKTRQRRVSLILVPEPGQRCAAPVNGALAPVRRASLSLRRVIEPGSMQGSLLRKAKNPPEAGFFNFGAQTRTTVRSTGEWRFSASP